MPVTIRPRTFYLRSFGCQMNDHDSERIAGVLGALGLSRVAEPEVAGVIVYNTCSIREKADSRLLGHLGGAKRIKEQFPHERLVIVAGCLAESRGAAFAEEHPFVDILCGPQSLHRLPELIEARLGADKPVTAFSRRTTVFSAELPRERVAGPRAWVQIMTGCTNYCSYCIVPYVRGPEASRSAADILREAHALVDDGVREITLLGQNVNAYGREPGFDGREDFADLLSRLAGIAGLERIRFMTSHPKDVSDKLVRAMGDLSPLCEHLHLPVQSGSSRVLEGMRRGYSREQYVELVGRLRAAIPDLSLTTDLIVGFPGETTADFEATLSLVQECAFDAAFTFVYSPRPGTRAADFPGRVDAGTADERVRTLIEQVQAQAERRNQDLVGRTVEVLVERASRNDRDMLMGRTRTHKTVNFSGNASVGDLVNVRVQQASSTSLRGMATAAAAAGAGTAAEKETGRSEANAARTAGADGAREQAASPRAGGGRPAADE